MYHSFYLNKGSVDIYGLIINHKVQIIIFLALYAVKCHVI